MQMQMGVKVPISVDSRKNKDDGTTVNGKVGGKEAAGLLGNVVLNARHEFYFQICLLKDTC